MQNAYTVPDTFWIDLIP